jgi:hypothetical protein
MFLVYPGTCLIIHNKNKVTFYWILIRAVVTYGSEVWTVSRGDENTFAVREGKILRKIFGPEKFTSI